MNNTEQKTKIEAKEGQQVLTITREFDLPKNALFKAYSEPELVERWMGTKVLKLENKNHGSFQFETSNNGHVVFKANGTIHTYQPNQKIIRTFEMEGAAVGVQLEFLEFMTLTDRTCKLTINIVYQSERHRAEQLKLPFAFGLNLAHNRLQDIVHNLI